MADESPGYILTEIWNAPDRRGWLCPRYERHRFFDEKIGPFIGSMVGSGAEFLDYFDQANFSDVAISVTVMNGEMIKLGI